LYFKINAYFKYTNFTVNRFLEQVYNTALKALSAWIYLVFEFSERNVSRSIFNSWNQLFVVLQYWNVILWRYSNRML